MEIILVNDGSPDVRTPGTDDLFAGDTRVRCLSLPKKLDQPLPTAAATELLRLLKTAQDHNGIQQHIDNRGATIGKQYNAGRDIRFGNDD